MASESIKRLGIVIGDPNGIGPEIAIKAALRLDPACARSVLIGDEFVIQACCDGLRLTDAERERVDIFNVGALEPRHWRPGTVDAHAGAATVAYVEAAVALAQAEKVSALAASPHCEAAVNAAGIPFSGYGGLVADISRCSRDEIFLMLAAPGLKIVHATLHERLTDALNRLTPELVEAASAAALDAVRRLGAVSPRLCVLGINPHAGEEGLFGDDDERITRPAVTRMQAKGMPVSGPVGADLALSERQHDVFLAMYHDQGHIPVKMLSPKGATALLAGAPFLFASVGHGTAFDIVGKGTADPAAMVATLELLCESYP